MGLRDWTVGIAEGATDDVNHEAEAACTTGQKIIWVYLSEHFLERTPDRQRQTLVHELLHAHTAPMHQFLCRLEIDKGVFAGYDLLMEYMVDGIAEEWAKSLPLPPEN